MMPGAFSIPKRISGEDSRCAVLIRRATVQGFALLRAEPFFITDICWYTKQMDYTLSRRIAKLTSEEISIVPYNPLWPDMFRKEEAFLRSVLPPSLIRRIEHFGSTAVPGLSAKPVIDILVEVTSLEATKQEIVPILEAHGYEYLWRPTIGDQPPWYAWFIKRDPSGVRTHHIHMVEADSELWDRLYFRDYLRKFPQEAQRYEQLKNDLQKKYSHDRVKYTAEKSAYIREVTERAQRLLKKD